ncbi:cytochrome c oxidase accessory protein CcoG [Serpentinimonas raichei]|uniref:cytochrome c oxidase accessory protein CcoG n=1 Tax=Serpentinimonas raichei TaxID=1458425 RepID=UPI0006941FDD
MSDTSNKPSGRPAAAAGVKPVVIPVYLEQEKIHPRSVSGFFSSWRWITVWITQIIFYGLPWLNWNDRQAVLFDLEARTFYLFNLVLFPHDLIYLTGLLVISALGLFLFTAVAGRLWCGFACPQTVYTEIYIWMEKLVEGDRSARMRLDQSGRSFAKFGKKTLKHTLWLAFALWTGFTFVGYFTPIDQLGQAVWQATLGPWQTFWVLFYGFATYGNAGFLREKICKFMCPYARFQSAMFDKDTLIVTYDAQRGEPRGSRSRTADLAALNLGSCVDCTLCVQVCPTGIDIRNGLQYECIGCGACADVCDEVMDKVGYPKGLVRFTTQNGLEQGWSAAQMWRRVMRPRVLIYSAILLLITLALFTSLYLRTPLKIDVTRDSSVMSRVVGQGYIENVYRLRVLNATEQVQHYRISVQGLPGLLIDSESRFSLEPTGARAMALTLRLPPGSSPAGAHPIRIEVQAEGNPDLRVGTDSIFMVPR